MHSSASVMQDTVEQDIEMLRHIEKVGGTHATLAHPVQYYPRSEEDIFQMYKFMCESTNLAITFYPGRLHTWHFHPSYFPPDVMRKISDIPNVVAMKVTGGSSIALTIQAFQLCGDRILVSDPMPDRWFFTIPEVRAAVGRRRALLLYADSRESANREDIRQFDQGRDRQGYGHLLGDVPAGPAGIAGRFLLSHRHGDRANG